MPGSPEATPRFSVLVPAYNHAAFLPVALGSLQAQVRGDWEAVVVDDGSTDGTWPLLEGLAAADPRIRPFRQANQGVGAALNAAVARARAPWVCWLSSDDLLLPEAFERFASAQEEDPGARFFHSDFLELLHPAGTLRTGPPDRARTLPEPWRQTLQFFHGNYIHGISICVQRSLFAEVGPFREDLRYAQDMDMWLRMSARTPLRYLDHRTCVTRVHEGQGTARFPEAGALDTAWACHAFLEAHPFEALFPLLDLTTADDITRAVQATLVAVLDLNAFMYAGLGPVPALLARLGEWLLQRCPAAYRASLLEGLRGVAAQMGAAPEPLRAAMEALGQGRPVGIASGDALALMAAEGRRAEARGDWAVARMIDRYLGRTAGPEAGPAAGPAEAFLLEPGAGDDTWVAWLLAYLRAFRAGEPVALVLLLDRDRGDLPSEEAVEGVVLELARRLGLEAFPDVRVAATPGDLLEALRACRRLLRLPLESGDRESPAGRRLAEAFAEERP